MNVQFTVDIENVEEDADIGVLHDALVAALLEKFVWLDFTVQDGECY